MKQPLPKFLACVLMLLTPTLVFGQHKIFSSSERRSAAGPLVWNNIQLDKDKNEWATSEERAEKAVLEKAQRTLSAWLQERYPGSSIQPSLAFIKEQLAKHNEKVHIRPEDEVPVDGEQVQRYSASVKLILDGEAQRKLQSEVEKQFVALRAEASWSREWLLMKGLLFLIAVAAAATGYFHFDDRTQGYYTTPLRAVALAAIALAGYGITLLP
jgi:hypothetical protein